MGAALVHLPVADLSTRLVGASTAVAVAYQLPCSRVGLEMVSVVPLTSLDGVRCSTLTRGAGEHDEGAAQSAKTSRVCWTKKLWSWPLWGSAELYALGELPSGTRSSE